MERALRSGAAVLLGLVPAAALAAANGGYFPSSWGWPALMLLFVAGGSALVRERGALGFRELLFAGGLLAFASWSALSAVWSPGMQDQVLQAERGLVYAAAAAAFLLAVRREETPALLAGVLAAAVGVCGWALLHRPGETAESNQLSEPIGYWNALAILAVIGILLALGFALTRRPFALRAAAAASLAVLVPALYLTYSRGGWVALAAGALVTAALRAPRRVRYALAGAVVVVVAVFVALGGLERATAAFSSPLQTGEEREELSQRLTSLSGNGRADYWRIAWQAVEDEPLLGAGAGSFERYWARYRPNEFYARDAHNLYLESLAELGPLGPALLLVALAVPLVAALRGPPLAAHAAGAYGAFLVHAALDWDWEIPAVTVPALACGAALIRLATPAERPLTARLRYALVGATIPLAAFAFVAQVGNSRIAQAEEALQRADAGEAAEARAKSARSWAPWSAEPLRVLATVEINRSDERAAGEYIVEALEQEPARWDLWWIAILTTGVEEQEAIAQVRRLNPRSQELSVLLDEGSP